MFKSFSTGLGLLAVVAVFSAQADYLSPDLRSRVDQLKASLDSKPTNERNAQARARLTWEWINAHAMNGGYVPVNSTQVVASVLAAGSNASPGPLDATIRELAFIDSNPSGLGTLTATVGPFEAGAYATVAQIFTVGSESIQTGGSIMLARHFMTNFGAWQTADPTAPNYLSIRTSASKVSFIATTSPLRGMHGGFRNFRETMTFELASGTLTTGDTVTVTWGDTSGGSPGLMMGTVSSDRMPLPVYVSFNNQDQFISLPIQPIQVVGTSISGVTGFAPSVLSPGEPFELSIRARDPYYNRATGDVPNWIVKLDGEPWLNVTSTGAISLVNTSLKDPGIYRPTIESTEGDIVGSINPILVSAENRERIYWGDTHGHSGFAEGIGTPERFMQWAKEDARLDYVTHSEHDIWLDDYEWEVLREIVRRYTKDGEFVAYLGYEWTVNNLRGGHHNVLFRTPDDRQRVPAQFFSTLARLYTGLRNAAKTDDVVVIPHAHQAGDYRLSDPALEPLIEIMSQHGNFEWFGRMYLKQGHQVGFTAASDNHLSQPGYSAALGNSLAQRGGLGAILAPNRTVDDIFDGMKALKSYATTGDRIILDFDINGVGMGQRAPFAEKRTITASVHGTAPIDSVTLMKNDQPIWQENYLQTESKRNRRELTLLLSFESASKPTNPGDNPRGWRTWDGTMQVVDAEILEITAVDASFPLQQLDTSEIASNLVRFATKTRGDTSSYLIKLKDTGRDARIQLDLLEALETGGAPPIYRAKQRSAAASFSLALRDVDKDSVTHTLAVDAYTDSVTVRRIHDTGVLDVEVSVEDESLRQGDYYYLRVVQANDAIAWSSPVWIGGHPAR
ncbi:MAG: hypothetical protein ACI9UU_000511 [Candidatus Azotimanducaceae bacterium]|jgi:hypothetical protein